MKILAIDPGNERSAWLVLENGKITEFGIDENADLLAKLPTLDTLDVDHLAIEMVASYGMAVGKTIFDTVFWIGRFAQAWDARFKWFTLVYRKDVKIHLCNSMKAKDANIRQALIDRYGEPGTKKNPGGTYGISKDVWSALAIATTFADKFSEV